MREIWRLRRGWRRRFCAITSMSHRLAGEARHSDLTVRLLSLLSRCRADRLLPLAGQLLVFFPTHVFASPPNEKDDSVVAPEATIARPRLPPRSEAFGNLAAGDHDGISDEDYQETDEALLMPTSLSFRTVRSSSSLSCVPRTDGSYSSRKPRIPARLSPPLVFLRLPRSAPSSTSRTSRTSRSSHPLEVRRRSKGPLSRSLVRRCVRRRRRRTCFFCTFGRRWFASSRATANRPGVRSGTCRRSSRNGSCRSCRLLAAAEREDSADT